MVEVTNIFKGLDLIECLKNCGFLTVHDIVKETVIKTNSKKKNAKRKWVV